MRQILVLALAVAASAIAALPATARASQMVGRNEHSISLIVNSRAIARVTYTTPSGQVVHVLAWGGINARTPTQSVSQVHFDLNYAGGWGSPFGAGYWRIMKNYCRPYTGPALPNLVAGCLAPDGTYWVLQSWIRLAQDGGYRNNAPAELQLSHWSGPLPRLTLYQNWERSNTSVDRVFGELTYGGSGVYGFSSTSTGSPTDSYGRNIYVDVHNVEWRATGWDIGAGWYRFNSGLAHRPAAGAVLPNGQPAEGGGFCLGMWPLYGRALAADGNAYRATAMGPGVTPIVRAEVAAVSAYSAAKQQQLIAFERTFTPSSDSCYTGGS